MLLLLTIVLIASVSSTLAPVADPTLLRFLNELVINVLHWKWFVIIEERQEEINPVLVENFLQKNVSVTVLTSRIERVIRKLLHRYNFLHVLLLFSSKVQTRPFLLDTCRIQWVVLMPNSVEALPSESIQNLHRLHVIYAVRQTDSVFTLQVPTEQMPGVLEINSWHPEKGFKNSSAFGQCSRKPVTHMRIAMEKHFPFYIPGNSTHLPQGSDVNLLNSLAMFMKFTYDITRPPDGAWGGKNGTEWNGMIRMVIRNEVDAALSGMTMNYERQREVQFSVPYTHDAVTFVTRKPALRLKTWAIFWPYRAHVWVSLAILVVLIALLLTWLQTRLKNPQQHRLRFRDSLLYIFQSILNQGYYNAREPSCRILMSFWWAFCITVIAGYNGSLMSFMAHPGLSPSLDTILKLIEAVKKGEMAVGTIENSADYAIFKDSEEPDLRILLKSMESDTRNLVHHDIEGLKETQRRNYAYIGGWVTVQADVWDPRLFLFSKDYFLNYGYAIAFTPGFDYVDTFNRKILQLRDSGLVQKWVREIIERNQHRSSVNDDSAEPDEDSEAPKQNSLRIEDVQGAFAVLSIGLLLGIVCCILENLIAWNQRKKKKPILQMTMNKDVCYKLCFKRCKK